MTLDLQMHLLAFWTFGTLRLLVSQLEAVATIVVFLSRIEVMAYIPIQGELKMKVLLKWKMN